MTHSGIPSLSAAAAASPRCSAPAPRSTSGPDSSSSSSNTAADAGAAAPACAGSPTLAKCTERGARSPLPPTFCRPTSGALSASASMAMCEQGPPRAGC